MPSKTKSKTNSRHRSSRPNRVDPIRSRHSDEVDGPEDEKKRLGFYNAARFATTALQGVTSAKKAASKWRNYVTSKRRLVTRSLMLHANEGKNSSAKNGQGLDDIHENFTKFSGSKKSMGASNRALIQYFAKLGQSPRSDEFLDLDFVEGLLAQGADINCTDTYGQSIFHEVARTWHTDVGKFLLEHGGNINIADNYGRTPLHVAAAVDYAEMCEFLINNGANKEAVTKGELQTPLFYAARNDATLALVTLVKAQCEYKELRDYRGRTPLYVAAELDRSETARYLLEHHAPVGVEDNSGQPALTWMINKMAPVAKEALNQLHTCDRANRKQYFYLNHLEPIIPGEEREGFAQMPLDVLVQCKNFELVLHPVIMEQIRIKWKKYGKLGAWKLLILQMIFVILWTTIAMHSPWYSKCSYMLPDEVWKILIYILAVALTVYQIVDELRDFVSSQSDHSKWKEWRIKQLDEDIAYCHPRWPEEKIFLENEKYDLDKFKSNYFQDFWNIFDWICYTFLLASTITHLLDVFIPNVNVALWHNRIMSLNIILVWLRTMKYVRCFSALGPFIVMIGEMVGDMLKFAFLYLVFLIPFSCAFSMVFGGDAANDYNTTMANSSIAPQCVVANLEGPSSNLISIAHMTKFDELFFTMYRLTLVDEYDLDGLLTKDKVMTYLLLGSWFWISAILCLNLFIALLSDTFQRVYDNARANAVMQKAITVLMIEDKLRAKPLKEYRDHINRVCSPEVVYYDDDTGEGSDELKKVTIQTKEKVDELIEMWTIKFGAPLHDEEGQKFYDTSGDDASDGDDSNGDDPGSGKKKGGSKRATTKEVVTSEKLENEIDILRAELTQVEKKRRDFEKKCLNELTTLRQLFTTNTAAGSGISQSQPRLPPLLPDYGALPGGSNTTSFQSTNSPPTYPAAIADRLTPRGDQMRSDVSTSHVDIATLPPHMASGAATQFSSTFTPALRIHSIMDPDAPYVPDETEDV